MGVDDSIGTVMAYLESRGIADETVVIYMGDNGFSWGEHGLIDKRHFYEESAKVPLLVRCPALFEGGGNSARAMQNIDIAPTIMALAGLEKDPNMHGESFLPLLKGEPVEWRDKVFYEYYWEYDFPMTPSVFGVRTDRYKYIRYHGIWDRNELYDLEADPHEMHNLIKSPEHQAIIRQLAGDIYDWLETTGGMQIPLKRTIKHCWVTTATKGNIERAQRGLRGVTGGESARQARCKLPTVPQFQVLRPSDPLLRRDPYPG